jgi:hypothetical protein
MSKIEIPQGERGVVRVFALSMDPAEAKALRKNEGTDAEDRSPIETALGASGLDTAKVEVFPLADVKEIGLQGYLEQGGGIERAQLDPDRRKLAALEGWVMVVYSSAFGGRGATLDPAPELTLVGTYTERGVDWSEKTKLSSAASEFTAPPEDATASAAKKKPSDAAMSGRIALIALLVLFALTAVVVWIAS